MTATQTNDNPDEPHSLTPRLRAEAADLDRDCTLGRRPAEPDHLQRRAAHFRRLSAALLDHVPAHPGSALVDLGCGPTGPLDLMAGRAGPSGCVVGIELDPVHVESARNFARERGLPTWRSSTGTPGGAGSDGGTGLIVRRGALLLYVSVGGEGNSTVRVLTQLAALALARIAAPRG